MEILGRLRLDLHISICQPETKIKILLSFIQRITKEDKLHPHKIHLH